jgi:hypothetical protein
MLLKRRPPGISPQNLEPSSGFEHLEADAVAVLRWLHKNKVDYVLVGPVARAVRGEQEAQGPVAIVPAPYGRNWERLSAALTGQRAGLRAESARRGPGATPVAAPLKLTADKLARGHRWLLRAGDYDLDIEATVITSATPPDGEATQAADVEPGYQELLYEASSFEIAAGLCVQVAAPEDLERYTHIRRTGNSPEFRITRAAASK